MIKEIEKAEDMIASFRNLMNKEKSSQIWVKISAAVGNSAFDITSDKSAEDVFKRADTAMYENKKEMKEKMKDY